MYRRIVGIVAALSASVMLGAFMPMRHAAKLQLEEFTADSTGFDVNSTLVIGPTEVLLVDAQYQVAMATKIADRIAATGKHLKAIVLTHPDDDHYYGVATILQRFPGTPVYMSPTGIDEFTTREVPQFVKMKARMAEAAKSGRTPPPAPDSLVTPEPFPGKEIMLDGTPIEIFPDNQGDVLKPSNTYFWIPSTRTAITGDIVFNGVHVWLAASNPESRAAWQESLKRIAALKPAVVVAGHKARVDLPDTPDAIAATSQYLHDFDAAKTGSTDKNSLIALMDAKYKDRAVHGILDYAAWKAYAP